MHNTVARAGKRHVGFPGRIIIWRPLKPIFFKIFQSRTRLAKVLRTAGQIADDFRRNSFFGVWRNPEFPNAICPIIPVIS
jgi:hypothetical protein